MSILDKILSKKINKAANVKVGQVVSSIKASLSGGRYGGFFSSGNGGSKWPAGLSSSGATQIIDHHETRKNARNAYHESLEARGIVDRMADTIIDTGLVLEATPDSAILNITPEAAEDWASDVERRFNLWALSKNQHRSGTLNFYQSQRLYEIFQQRDNDIFVRFYYSGKKHLQNPLQFEFIDPNQIRGYGITTTEYQYNYEDGINRNPDGTEKSYKIWIKDPKKPGSFKDVTIPRIGEKSKRTMMIHGFSPEYAGQGRGYARLHFAMQDMENVTDFTLSAIKKAINQSSMVFSVENQQKDPGDPLEGIENSLNTSAMGSNLSGDAEEILNELSRNPTYCPIPEATDQVPGSKAFVGNEMGDTIKMLDTKAPADNFKEFIFTFTDRLAAAMSIPHEVVLMKFSNNYSASRATLLLFWKVVQIWRMEISTDYLNPIYESWLMGEIASGRISAPGFNDPVLRAAWISSKWIGSSLPSIDPGKEAKARKDNLEMNLTTLDREAKDLNGSDIKINIEKNRKTFDDLPNPPWSGAAIAEEQQQDPDNSDEGDNKDE